MSRLGQSKIIENTDISNYLAGIRIFALGNTTIQVILPKNRKNSTRIPLTPTRTWKYIKRANSNYFIVQSLENYNVQILLLENLTQCQLLSSIHVLLMLGLYTDYIGYCVKYTQIKQ